MKTYTIEEFGIIVDVEDGYGEVNSELHEHNETPSTDGWLDEQTYNSMMDAIESLVLAHACEGIDVSSEAYVNGLRTAVEACGNNV
jgi:hypothetical protein